MPRCRQSALYPGSLRNVLPVERQGLHAGWLTWFLTVTLIFAHAVLFRLFYPCQRQRADALRNAQAAERSPQENRAHRGTSQGASCADRCVGEPSVANRRIRPRLLFVARQTGFGRIRRNVRGFAFQLRVFLQRNLYDPWFRRHLSDRATAHDLWHRVAGGLADDQLDGFVHLFGDAKALVGARCDVPIGCYCSFGLDLRDWLSP